MALDGIPKHQLITAWSVPNPRAVNGAGVHGVRFFESEEHHFDLLFAFFCCCNGEGIKVFVYCAFLEIQIQEIEQTVFESILENLA